MGQSILKHCVVLAIKNGYKDYEQHEACIGRDSLFLFPHVCKGFVYSTREIEDTDVVWFKSVVGSWERDAN